MKDGAIEIFKQENRQFDSVEINELQQKLYSSKHDIRLIRESFQNFNDKKDQFIQEINKVKQNLSNINCNWSNGFSEVKEPENIFETPLKCVHEIRCLLKEIRRNEGNLRQEYYKKNIVIKDFQLQKNHWMQQLEEYRRLVLVGHARNVLLKKALTYCKPDNYELSLCLADDKLQNFNTDSEKSKLTCSSLIYNNKNFSSELTESEPRISRQSLMSILSLEEKLIEILKNKKQQKNYIKVIRGEAQEKKKALKAITLPTLEEQQLNIIKRGSWIKLAWNWWNNETQKQNFENEEDLKSTIKEFQFTLDSYEKLLEKMNDNLEKYDESEEEYIKEIAELKEQLSRFVKNETEYFERIKHLENKVVKYEEQNRLLEDKNKEFQTQVEQYKETIERIKNQESKKKQMITKTLHDVQEVDKGYTESLQRINQLDQKSKNKGQRKFSFSGIENRQNKSKQKVVNNYERHSGQIQKKLDLIKKFYPHAQTQNSVFNPFK
jgi:hypothetical protein